MATLKMTKDQYEHMLRQLEKKGTHGLNKFANVLLAGAGAAAGAGVAPAIAAIAGANAVPALSYLGNLVGIAVVGTTPIGWVIGCGVAGASIACGIGVIAKKAALHNEKLRLLKEDILEKIRNYKSEFSEMSEEEQFKKVMHILRMAYYDNKKISSENGSYIIAQLGSKQIKPTQALTICEDLIRQ